MEYNYAGSYIKIDARLSNGIDLFAASIKNTHRL